VQLNALAYNLGNFLRTLVTPELIKDWSLTSPQRETDQDRRRGHPWPLHCLPDGRCRDPRQIFQEIFAGIEAAARASMRAVDGYAFESTWRED
jgi:hypothetical protein